MKFLYETQRLLMKVLDGKYANDVLYFYLSNREIFEHYEAERPENFYTKDYQQRILNYEYNLFIKQNAVRFWIYEKTDPSHIIGTVCFRDIIRTIYQCCEIGYKFDQLSWHHGYACEALSKSLEIAFFEMRLHRITARIMPENTSSIRLVERVGFHLEGIARECAFIGGTWQDHLVYSILQHDKLSS